MREEAAKHMAEKEHEHIVRLKLFLHREMNSVYSIVTVYAICESL